MTQPPPPPTLCFFDLETTGLNPRAVNIVQIAAVAVRDGREVGTFDQMVRADQPMDAKASEITGITDASLIGARRCKPVLKAFRKFIDRMRALGGEVTLIAHNGYSFDYRILYYELRRYAPNISFADVALFDTLPTFRATLDYNRLKKNAAGQSSYRLGDLHESLVGSVAEEAAHNALNDCRILHRVFVAAGTQIDRVPKYMWSDIKRLCESVPAKPVLKRQRADMSVADMMMSKPRGHGPTRWKQASCLNLSSLASRVSMM